MEMKLGKIKAARFGYGGYQDVQIIFSFDVGGDGWGTTYTFECGWGHVSKEELEAPGSTYKWTHDSRVKQLGEKAWQVFELMREAKVKSLDQMVGIPVKAYFESPMGRNTHFEILKEVL